VRDTVLKLGTAEIVTLAGRPPFRADLELRLLDDGTDRIASAFDRALSLVPLLTKQSVNVFTEKYLARVARLYLWGFDPEVYVMCRAALDSALQDLLVQERVREVLGLGDSAQISLGVRVQLARYSDPALLSDRTWALAYWLKEDGNDVIHTDPHLQLHHRSSREAVESLVEILESFPQASSSVRINRWPADAPWRPTP
jgi:hypothetical protein